VRKQVGGHRPKISIDELVGHTRVRLVSKAEEVRDAVVLALRDRPAGTDLMPYLRAHPAIVAFRTDAPPVAAVALTAAASVPLADVGAAYVTALEADPDRLPTYLEGVRAKVARVTAWPLEVAHAGFAAGTPLGRLPVGVVTDDLLEAFLHGLARAGKSVSTKNKYLDFLRRLGRWAKSKNYRTDAWLTPGDPHGPKRKTETKRQRRLQPGELVRLLAAANPLMQALIIAGLDLGARLGELLRIRWEDIDLTRAHVWVTDLKDATRRRQLPISTRLLAVLAMRRTAPDGEPHGLDAYVFGNEVGERVTTVYTAWQNTVLKAHGHPVRRESRREDGRQNSHGLTPESLAAYHAIDLIFSDLRHEATSTWLDAGVPMHTVRDWLGHTTFAMLSTYGHTSPTESARAMRAFEAAQAAAAAAAAADAAGGPTVAPAGKVAQSGPTAAQQAKKRQAKKSGNSLVH